MIMETDLDFLDSVTNYDSCLGQGSFGFVLKAEHNDKTYTCIKFIYPTYDERQAVQRESSLTTKLPFHENIVTVKDSVRNKL